MESSMPSDVTINVKIIRKKEENGKIVGATLNFEFKDKIEFDLSSDKVEDIQTFFASLLNVTIDKKENYSFKLQDEENDLFHDVSVKYLELLTSELFSSQSSFSAYLSSE